MRQIGPVASVYREKTTKRASLEVVEDGSWRLYAGTSFATIDFSQAVLAGKEAGFFDIPVDARIRWYFVLEREGERAGLAERLLPMEGGYNFRDLGGMPTADSRQVRWGLLFRSDSLKRLTPEDLTYLNSVPVRTLVDFRTDEEYARSPDRIPSSVERHLRYAITPGELPPGSGLEDLHAQGVDDNFMEEVNRLMVRDQTIIACYRDFFRMVQDASCLPLLFHCAAGKDRTGFAAAAILFSLGVDKETVMNDYMASGVHLSGKYDHVIAAHPERAVLFMVKPNYLQAAIDAMEERSGSVEAYLTDVLHIRPEKMRALFLS